MFFEASKGDPSFIQVMLGDGKASASQIKEMGLLMVTVTSSLAFFSGTPRMVGTTVRGRQGRPWLTGSSLGLGTLMTRTARTLGFSLVMYCMRRVGNAAQGSQAPLHQAATL